MTEKRKRGFAAMTPEQQRKIASMGGRAAHERGTAHEWNAMEAAEAGRRGGKAQGRRAAESTGAAFLTEVELPEATLRERVRRIPSSPGQAMSKVGHDPQDDHSRNDETQPINGA
jgi:uncharacterized protein